MKEAELPLDVDPLKFDLKDPLERQTIAKKLSQGLNSEADGEHKRLLANNLARKLLASNTNGGLLHHAQGKWYPGEPLPRWQTSIYWRKDGKAIWENPELLADMNKTYP